VVFADENLEAAIREELEKPEDSLTKKVIRELTKLNASEREIKDLLGLDSAVNLIRLDLRVNQISHVSPLASLTNLTDLYLYTHQVRGPYPVSKSSSLPISCSAAPGIRWV
jgi:hypothetical protein